MTCLGYRSVQLSRTPIITAILLAGTLALVGAASSRVQATNEVWQKSDLIQPEELAATLDHPNQEKPVIVFIGFDFLFRAAHIPGSLYFGPGSRVSGVESLRRWANGVKKDRAVVLYCGCCPWRQCPNVRPAFQAARQAGLKRVKVLYLPDSFIRDWVDKGYPVEKGK